VMKRFRLNKDERTIMREMGNEVLDLRFDHRTSSKCALCPVTNGSGLDDLVEHNLPHRVRECDLLLVEARSASPGFETIWLLDESKLEN
jgi:hypothetical protein